jgi:hypothetical protein
MKNLLQRIAAMLRRPSCTMQPPLLQSEFQFLKRGLTRKSGVGTYLTDLTVHPARMNTTLSHRASNRMNTGQPSTQ